MKVYSIFDDFSLEANKHSRGGGAIIDVLPYGNPRPTGEALKNIINDYDVIIVGTGQKITEDMLFDIKSKKIIATASIGIDHIRIPENKIDMVKLVNAPVANRVSVAEHVFGLIIALEKQFINARDISAKGLNKSFMTNKPQDLFGKTFGVIGTGGIGLTVIRYAKALGLKVICFSNDTPERKVEIGEKFVNLNELLAESDIILTALPFVSSTKNFISKKQIEMMKDTATFISIAHSGVVDVKAAIEHAHNNKNFKVGIDIDTVDTYPYFCGNEENIIITPHIAGGTVESRQRMFVEVSQNIIRYKDFLS